LALLFKGERANKRFWGVSKRKEEAKKQIYLKKEKQKSKHTLRKRSKKRKGKRPPCISAINPEPKNPKITEKK